MSAVTKSLIAASVVIGIAAALSLHSNDPGYRTVVKYPNGAMGVQFDPGPHLTWGGETWVYPDYLSYNFGTGDGSCNFNDNTLNPTVPDGLAVQWSEGGKGSICGSARVKLTASNAEEMIAFHTEYRDEEGARLKLLSKIIPAAASMTAGLVTSTEAYTTHRAQVVRMFQEQIEHGIYITEAGEEIQKITETVVNKDGSTFQQEAQQVRHVAVTIPDPDSTTGKKHKESSGLNRLGITVSQLDITGLSFESATVARVGEQRDAENKASTAKANADKAFWEEQQVVADGKKLEAIATYEAKVKAAPAIVAAESAATVAVTLAEQKLEVARQLLLTETKLAEAAIQTEAKLKSIGRGTAEAAKAIFEADGGLQVKLDAWTKSQVAFAEAAGKQRLVPEIQMGGSESSGGSTALTNFMEIMSVNAAKSLQLDLSLPDQSIHR